MGPSSAAAAAVLFLEIVCCSIARPVCLRFVLVVPALAPGGFSVLVMLLVVRAYVCMFHTATRYMTTPAHSKPPKPPPITEKLQQVHTDTPSC